MYDNGKGVSQNYIRAHMWFNFAVAQGNEMTRKNRDIVAKRMTSAQIAEAQRLVREWKPKKLGEIMRRIVLVVGVCVGVTVVGAEEGLSRE